MNAPLDDQSPLGSAGSVGKMVEGQDLAPRNQYGSYADEKALDKDPSQIGPTVGSAAGCLVIAYILMTVAFVRTLLIKDTFNDHEVWLYGFFTLGFFAIIGIYLHKGHLKAAANSDGATFEIGGDG